jgi:hypothetical protein
MGAFLLSAQRESGSVVRPEIVRAGRFPDFLP